MGIQEIKFVRGRRFEHFRKDARTERILRARCDERNKEKKND